MRNCVMRKITFGACFIAIESNLNFEKHIQSVTLQSLAKLETKD